MPGNEECRPLMCKIRERQKVDNQNTITQNAEYQISAELSTEASLGFAPERLRCMSF